MKHIKNWILFTETYSEDLSQVLDNKKTNFVVMRGGNIIQGFGNILDSFSEVAKLLGDEKILTEEQVEEFNNDVTNASISNDISQESINTILNDLLDKYEVIAPYRIENRMELEETPVERDEDIDQDLYGEDLTEQPIVEGLDDGYCIQGVLNGELKQIEPFDSKDEADSFLDEYKKIYTEYTDIEVALIDEKK